jgi:hypothetical protein
MKSWAGLGWHWLWFAPLCVVVLCLVEVHVVRFAFGTLHLYWQRWTWGAFISPSSDFCLGVTMLSVVFPISGLIFAAILVAEKHTPWAVVVVVGICLLPFITDTLIWGSFPFITDNQGVSRLRMIPFFPWPSGHYLEI